MITYSGSFRERLSHTLSRLNPSRVVGLGGLAVLCAASALSLLPLSSGNPTLGRLLAQAAAGLGLNILASVLEERCRTLLARLPQDDIDRLVALASSLEQDIEDLPELRREIGEFLEKQGAFEIAQELVQGNPAVHSWLLVKIYQDVTQYGTDFERIHQTLDQIKSRLDALQSGQFGLRPLTVPPMPAMLIGRADARRHLKSRLGIAGPEDTVAGRHALTIVAGWPGVGKTTLAAALANDPDVNSAFPDGVLWTSLDQRPDLLSKLTRWGRALGTDALLRARTLSEAQTLLAALLRDKRVLLMVDDVWEAAHVVPCMVGGPQCATLITTRLPEVAQLLATSANDIYNLEKLSDKSALELLRTIAPAIVARYLAECLELVKDLEGLPLALHVAGRLLNAEASLNFSVTDLITELRAGAKLLEAKAPKDRTDLENQTLPTVAVLLQKSTSLLDAFTLECFAFLGAFAPKPATFDLAALKSVWQVDDPKPIVRTLSERGLMEPVPPNRFQMHALLVMLARSWLTP